MVGVLVWFVGWFVALFDWWVGLLHWCFLVQVEGLSCYGCDTKSGIAMSLFMGNSLI